MILLDTHVLIWLMAGSSRLGTSSRVALDAAHREEAICISAISFWETAMLSAKGRVDLGQSTETWRRDVLAAGLREIPVDGRIGISAASLEGFHGDPADRIITATAVTNRASLMTADSRMLSWGGDLSREDATQ